MTAIATNGLALLLFATASADAGTDDARRILEEARAACVAQRSASYEGRCETTGGSSARQTQGRVQFAKFDYSDVIGGRLAFQGTALKAGYDGEGRRLPPEKGGRETEFQAVYDGAQARRLMSDKQVMLQGDLNHGGEGVLESTGYEIVLRPFLDEAPFAQELAAPALTLGSTEVIDDVECDVVQVTYAAADETGRWWIGRADRLPRRFERQYRSARGRNATSVVTVSGLVSGAPVQDSVFVLEAPKEWQVETVGKKPPPPIKVGDMAPDFTLVDGNGSERSLHDYRGQVVVIEFWASWCHYCQESMPALQRLHEKWAGRGAAVLAVQCRDSSSVDGADIVRKKGYSYTVLRDGTAPAAQYRVSGIPHVFVIGPDGRVIQEGVGFGQTTEARLDAVIARNVRR